MQEPKPKKVAQKGPVPTKEDIAFSKRSGISIEEVMAQGGVTPSSVSKQIAKTRSYDVRYGPGLYKKTVKKKK